ncbi:tryptophan synthase subunit alpha [Aetokthonos hydrillicola Thurmond2011]|jgi:tryptophan synthase alpha chain|uniref:Tryptophan synthase alpha chain n=1 Tax=Aetokthonos hydrillicola Thurmond2011 TaxID=2712845 RepID=A0AAP5MA58_9CYAN|nr:tryptophan synthase subunit alpha [Aetokthonos hydrillicola]MBO3458236.1 tryptophan synthase subunit alpha [Aetokthonos hydrillicola CCALA 1050]MBW4584455.1 tryptophan synthase subunit alpha [Aetokthonos hydrillicola CCALA 1050]MDR9896417.1 tryptophan synthase subunit alpha [Aetokthonos hydrillicola Thurmond2011]
MTYISQHFESLRAKKQCALIPFITAGDPDLETTAEALRVLDGSGADLIELGVPYTDPLADGPVIQMAATRAVKQGTRLAHVLEMAQSITRSLRSPIILFSYYNPILNMGVQQFLKKVADSGIKGLVVPDLPLEEAGNLLQFADSVGVEVTLLVTPNSSQERIQAIARQSRGFIYLVSVTGVTGMRSQVHGRIKTVLSEIRSVTDKPVGVGFGISSPEQARQVREWGADAVIVGSAFVQRLGETTPYRGLRAISDFCNELKASITPTVAI